MLVTTEPKTTFQKNTDQSSAFKALVDSTVFHEGLHKSIAEFVLFHNPTAEELEGVRRFLDVFLNMAEKPEPHDPKPLMTSIAAIKPQPKK